MSKKLKILHLLASCNYYGAETIVCEIITNLTNFNMAYASSNGPVKDILKSKNIKFYPLEKFNHKYLNKIIKEYNPDIIHAHDYRASILVATSNFKGKIISHLHNNCPFAKTWNLKTIIYSLTIKRYDKIVLVSDEILNEAVFKDKIINKCITISNVINKENVIKKANSYFDKKYDLFFIGRLSEQKNPLEFIEIVKEIKNKISGIKAVMIGDGDLKEDCNTLIKKYNLENNIELVGFCINPFKIIKNSRIGIMPSLWEGFGLTSIESLILNKPILNSGLGGLKEIFKNHEQLICKNKLNYVNKAINLLTRENKFNFNDIYNKYCNLESFKNNIENLYKEKINICFHINDISKCGGCEKVTLEIANLLLTNYDYYNVYIFSNYCNENMFFTCNSSIKFINLNNKNKFKTIKLTKKYIKDLKIDILIGVDTIMALYDIPVIFKTNCKYIAWEHFNYYENLGKRVRDLARKIACFKAHALVVLTKQDKINYQTNLKIKSRLIQIYNPYISKDKYKYQTSSNIILSIGRLTEQKGFDMLIEIANNLKKKDIVFKWFILGDGEEKENLKRKIDEYNLSNYVILKGWVKDISSYYKKSKLFVSTSRYEGLPLVFLEAKSYNLPIISFDINCGPSELIIDNVNGYLIPPFDINLMTIKIIELLDNKSLKMSKLSGFKMDEFREKEVIKKWDRLFKSILNK